MFCDAQYAQYINSKHLNKGHVIFDRFYNIRSWLATTNNDHILNSSWLKELTVKISSVDLMLVKWIWNPRWLAQCFVKYNVVLALCLNISADIEVNYVEINHCNYSNLMNPVTLYVWHIVAKNSESSEVRETSYDCRWWILVFLFWYSSNRSSSAKRISHYINAKLAIIIWLTVQVIILEKI